MLELHGAYTALITPFTEDGQTVDFNRLRRAIDTQSIAGVRGIVPCGTTGETPTLSDDEYRRVIETAIEAASPLELTVIAGAGSNCTAHAIELHRFVQRAGADAALHVSPYYNKPSQEGLFRHFTAIADSCDLPIVLYNIPGRTGVALTLDTIVRLAEHESIIAIKEATGSIDLAGRIVAETPLTVLSGDDPLTLPLATIGARGVISVLGNILPDRVSAMCDALLRDDWREARHINEQILPLARALLTLDTNPVPVKTALKILGRDTGALRLPLCPPARSVEIALAELLGMLVPEPVGAGV
jgi:4-hydroxy-tetrahydrodipicolinate synthase